MGNSQSIVREPSSQSMPHTQQRQVKSVMKRSRSTRNTAATTTREDADSSSSQARYIPKGLSPNHNGLIMPTKPFSNSNDGHVSPQWGWYINTTPPTPDMFHRNSSLSSKPTDTGSSSFHRRPATLTNPAFKGIAGSSSHQKNPAVHHWPSVPL